MSFSFKGYSHDHVWQLLRSPTSSKEVVATEEVYCLILKTADAYENAGSSTNNNGAVHARFLRILVENDRHRFGQRDGGVQIDPRLQGMKRMLCLTVDLFLLRVSGYSF